MCICERNMGYLRGHIWRHKRCEKTKEACFDTTIWALHNEVKGDDCGHTKEIHSHCKRFDRSRQRVWQGRVKHKDFEMLG